MHQHAAPDPATTKEVFLAARRISAPAARRHYLQQVCGDDNQLRRRVEQLLAARDRPTGNPLDEVAQQLAAWHDSPAAGDEVAQDPKDSTATSEAGLEPAEDLATLPPVGPYRLLERLGEGGMGTIYRARQSEPVQRDVALKLVKPGMDSSEVLMRFAAERQALAVMNHPHIARIYDAGVSEQGRPYFAMELVRGLPIDDCCQRNELSLPDRLRLFVDVCRAVHHAHQNGIIHRDLKPSNVLVASHDGVPVVKVIDFGIAKALDTESANQTRFTRFSQLVGTPVYMSPEQAALGGQAVDTRTDIYSLGVLLYKLLTGTTPLDAETLREAGFDGMRRLIREQDPPRPSSRLSTEQDDRTTQVHGDKHAIRRLRSQVRGELDWIVMKALEKDRERRYDSAAEFAEDVRRFLNNEPVEACPPSMLYRGRKAIRRHRVAVALTSVVLVALLVTTAVSIWQVVTVRRAWQESVAREREANNLLEVAQLMAATEAFRQSDLRELTTTLKPLIGRQKPPDKAATATEASLVGLLRHAAQPRPERTFSHPSAVHEMAPTPDGRRLVTVDGTGTLRLWDLNSSAPAVVLGKHRDEAVAVAVSPDGAVVVSGTKSGYVYFWDLESRSLTSRKLVASTGVETLRWSPDGAYLAIGARYSEMVVLDAAGQQVGKFANDQRHESLLFSQDGRRLICPTRTHLVVWDIESGKSVQGIAVEPLSNIRAMAWAGPQRRWILAGDRYSEKLLVFDADNPSRRRLFPVSAPYAQSLAALDDSHWVAVAYPDGRLQVLYIAEGFEGKISASVALDFMGHTQVEQRSCVSGVPGQPDQFLSAGADGQVHLWNRRTIKPFTVIHAKDDARYACLRSGGGLAYFRHRNGKQGDRLRVIGHRGETLTLGPRSKRPIQQIDGGGDFVAVADGNHVVLYSLQTGEPISQAESPLKQHNRLALSTDASRVAALGKDQVLAWNVNHETGWTLVGKWELSGARDLCFTDDAQTLLVTVGDRLVELDLASGPNARTRELNGPFAISRDGRWLAMIDNLVVRVLDRQTDRVAAELTTRSKFSQLTFTHDGRTLITVHEDEVVRAWHLPTGRPLGDLYRPLAPMGAPESLRWSPDGLRLLVAYRVEATLNYVVLGTP